MINGKTAYEAFKESNIWHKEYDLPLPPQTNNPFIYAAWATKVINEHDGINLMDATIDSPYYDYYLKVMNHISKCEVKPGLFYRWPGGAGGGTSHDELMGIAWFSQSAAKRILHYLSDNDGIYNSQNEDGFQERFNMNRLYWFIVYLKACAGAKLSLISQVMWSLFILWDMVKFKKDTDDTGGRSRIWMMLGVFANFPISGLFVRLWVWRMNNLGITPQAMLSVEPGRQNPVIGQYAPTRYSIS